MSVKKTITVTLDELLSLEENVRRALVEKFHAAETVVEADVDQAEGEVDVPVAPPVAEPSTDPTPQG